MQHNSEERISRLTVFLEVTAGIERLELGVGVGAIGRNGRRDLKRVTFDDVGGARADAEQVRVGNDAEGLVILDDGTLFVPLGVRVQERPELRRQIERRFEYTRVFLWQSYLHLSS